MGTPVYSCAHDQRKSGFELTNFLIKSGMLLQEEMGNLVGVHFLV